MNWIEIWAMIEVVGTAIGVVFIGALFVIYCVTKAIEYWLNWRNK